MKIITLPMASLSNLIMINIEIWHKERQKFVNMLIACDTGASVTTISSDILQKLGYDSTRGDVKRITTASTVNYVKSVNIDQIRIGETETHICTDIESYAHTFPAESMITGVLGLNWV